MLTNQCLLHTPTPTGGFKRLTKPGRAVTGRNVDHKLPLAYRLRECPDERGTIGAQMESVMMRSFLGKALAPDCSSNCGRALVRDAVFLSRSAVWHPRVGRVGVVF
jgi:hypothetical protein